MFNHTLKLMWNKKGKHFFFFIEILIIFFVLTMTVLYSIDHLKNYFVPIGYETENLYRFQGDFEPIEDSLQLTNIKERITREAKEINDIESMSWISYAAPFSGSNWGIGNNDFGFYFHSTFMIGDENIAQTLGLNITEGRNFTKDDYKDKYIPVIMNKKSYNLIVKAVGHEMLDSIFNNHNDFHIIGIVDHFKQNSEFEDEHNYFIALDHKNFIKNRSDVLTNLLIKTKPNADPSFQSKLNTIYQDIARINDLFISDINESRQHDSASYWILLSSVGIIALFLLINISLGLIGILSYNISQRKPEIGLRKALGATTGKIVGQFVGEVMLVAGIALFLGLIIILQLPYVTDFQFEKKDLYIATAISLAFIVILLLLSSITPSLRGARIEPSNALHEE